MGSKPKGLALIINIRDYVNKIKDLREGSEEDVRRLKSTLEQLDYKVTICEDPTKVVSNNLNILHYSVYL
ncbi:hypothetical protein J6590_063400 [Homalodisca vitripennis]|nr:hypothetical protein J6590_063400 [Homalodisca vitripennis]